MSMTVLQRACLIPDDFECNPKEKHYPTPGEGLMINPFPKVKKKKKAKGKKKK
jgi:hypothetical protein